MQSPSEQLGTSVREALQSDAARICALASQLGYEVTQQHVEQRLKAQRHDRALLVAVVPRAGVVGWIGIAVSQSLTSVDRAEIEGLVVEHEYRGNGIGELLLAGAERWARQRGCTNMRVLSNIVRDRAHRFYERLGYDILKTEYVFKKDL
ncbi:MAG TPA: GNAT family N-acetyltransferase [Candidatus Baltobacteraceae bacterium]|jgi:GNAT superfamily N-acetyltransferase|nr:GNAT family N-acetyltransferase [Candidatus Baltobacteraceae bacterium]